MLHNTKSRSLYSPSHLCLLIMCAACAIFGDPLEDEDEEATGDEKEQHEL